MSLFFSVAGLLLAGVFLALLLKQCGMTPLAMVLGLTVGSLVLLRLLPALGDVLVLFRRLAEGAGLNRLYLGVLLKIVVVSYVAEFVAGLCRDAGESALAAKVELAAKVVIMTLSVPIIVNILDSVVNVLR